LGTVVGFVLSLQFTRLPTVPTIVATMLVLSVLILMVEHGMIRVLGKCTPCEK
jgi:hypothetical protein